VELEQQCYAQLHIVRARRPPGLHHLLAAHQNPPATSNSSGSGGGSGGGSGEPNGALGSSCGSSRAVLPLGGFLSDEITCLSCNSR
jgi:hypothetical protein